MRTDPSHVKFYFDKNIWSDIVSMTALEQRNLRSLLQPLKVQSKIGVWYSPIGVLELVKQGSMESYYDECQREVRFASDLTNKNILDNPWDHVRRMADRYMGKAFREPDTGFLNLCRELAVLPYGQMKHKIAQLRKAARWEQNWVQNLIRVASDMRREFGLEPRDRTRRAQTNEFRTVRGIFWRRMKNWRYFCRHFRLPREVEDLSFEEAIRWFPSFLYWVDYRITYENMIIYENKKPRPSDYFDWEQLVYLNIMDYLVTNDRGLKRILRESINPELARATLGFDEFVACLRGELPPPRAPDSASKKWFDARI